jgi:hypothetical protein
MSETPNKKKILTVVNPETGSVCDTITKKNSDLFCHVSQDPLWEDATWQVTTTFALVIPTLFRPGKHKGLATISTLGMLLLFDTLYKLFTMAEKVEQIHLPEQVVNQYNDFKIKGENDWHFIVHNPYLRNHTVSVYSELESFCIDNYGTHIVPPPPVLAIFYHNNTNNILTAGEAQSTHIHNEMFDGN